MESFKEEKNICLDCNGTDFFNYKDKIVCKNCKLVFEKEDETKVRDHCHYTGKYRGAAHNICNINYKKPKKFPVIFHNLSGYDAHIFITKLGGEINCIANNEEKYISFSKKIIVDTFIDKEKEKKVEVKREIRFIDSFKFMQTSLENLVKNLSRDQCKNMAKRFDEDKLDILLRKGVYPYEYMNCFEKFKETKLPQINEFYSKLKGLNISVEDYEHAQKVWEEFEIETMEEYHDLYLETDTILLADVFENFRDVCIKNYKLDPAWYYTSPGLAWDAMLRMTKVNLELLSDYDMILMIEKGIRGGISTATKRYCKANNPYMENYNLSEQIKYIIYLDANNLYGYAMSKPLPISDFKWMNNSELNNWKKFPCFLEVDLKYPYQLHDLHNDYPLAPEQKNIKNVTKLIPNLFDKKKYVIHHQTLKLYERLGLEIT